MEAMESPSLLKVLDQDLCQSSHKNCRRPKLKGFDFCHKHILEDNNSPFQRCCFMSKSSGKQCTNPAPKIKDKKTFCLVHTRNPKLKKAHAEQLKRKKSLTSHADGSSNEQKYILRPNLSSPEARHSRHRKRSHSGEITAEVEDIEEHANHEQNVETSDSTMVQTTWFGDQLSDAESVDSEEEDPLRHAGVWTLEEGIRVYCNKLRRLKHLYKCQYNRLTHVLKERRRKYLLPYVENGKLVKPEGASIPLSEEDRVLRSYQTLNGAEMLLLRQAREKKSRVTHKMTHQLKCHHSSQGQRCPSKVLPMAKYCIEHICEDPNQFLYKQCTYEGPGIKNSCPCPVFSLTGVPLCDMHVSLRPSVLNEALEKLKDDKQKRELLEPREPKTQASEPDSSEASAVDTTPVAGAQSSSPGNIFSILESDEPKKEGAPDEAPSSAVKGQAPDSKEEDAKPSDSVKKDNETCEKEVDIALARSEEPPTSIPGAS